MVIADKFKGDKLSDKRDLAIKKFEGMPEVKVMVAGLRCGGVGLNLAFANRVIIV
jgi:SNF2 family DNA or RNA helicase